MIRDIPFTCDLENSVLELKFQAELSKIVDHYDFLVRGIQVYDGKDRQSSCL